MDAEPLDAEELKRYARHLVLPEIGGAGQQRLKAARVLILGAGGLGSPVLMYLAAAGVGTIGIVDDDKVSLSNLQRQIVHTTETVDQPKAENAARIGHKINPHVAFEPHPLRLSEANAAGLIGAYDIVVDGSDNFETRYLLADLCAAMEKTLVTGAVGRFDGSVTVLQPWLKDAEGRDNPSYRDLFPEPPPQGTIPSCAEAGVIGALTGVIGSLQAMEVIKLITGAGEPLIGRLLLYDGLAARFETIRYRSKRPG